MKFLRIILVLYAILSLIGGLRLLVNHKSGLLLILGIYLLINSAVIFAGSLFDRIRYKPKNSSKEGWETSGEKFIDPKSGKKVEVSFNPKTGERKYHEA